MTTYKITTIAQGVEQLTRSIGALRSGLEGISETADAIDEVLSDFSDFGITLNHVAIGDGWRAEDDWYRRPFGHSLATVGVRRDPDTKLAKHEHGRSHTISGLMNIYTTAQGRGRTGLKLTRWKTDAELDPKYTPKDRDSYMALFDLLKEMEELNTSIYTTHQEYESISRQYVKTITNSNQLRGAYVTCDTSRRNVTGWVVSGRGKTLHIQPDPWSELFLLQSQYSITNSTEKKLERAGWTATTRVYKDKDEIAMMPETERFTIGDALTLKVWLPPKLGYQRMVNVGKLDERAKAATAAAKKTIQPIIYFRENGGPNAIHHKESIERVLRSMGMWNAPTAINSLPEGPMKVFATTALSKMTEDELDDIFEEAKLQAISRVGGPLLEAEIKLLADIPEGWNNTDLGSMIKDQFISIGGELYEA